ncbi:MAG TPA: dihydrofolate reductase family protein [Gaiellaceae bacterium]|nr:dihydrofolate reductase family protein [Gaiellaceae bacterium]
MQTFLNISMSLDGFVAGPNQTLEEPLGEGGEQLHEWVVGLESWRAQHGLEGGESNADADLVRETNERTGAFVMGRRMFSGGAGPWEDDPKANGWWGDDPPFGGPVFVVTHQQREPLVLGTTTFTFVDGVEEAIRRARQAAGDRDVQISGGASVAQQTLDAGLLDELHIHVAPVLLGAGVRLFEDPERRPIELTRVIGSPRVTHLQYRVAG